MRYHHTVFGCNARRWVLLLSALVTPLACGGDDDDGEPAEPTPAPTAAASPSELTLPSGVTVFVEFPRYLHAARRLEVAFDNQGDAQLTITELVLRSPLFEPVAPDPRQTIVETGRRRDLQIGLGAAVCPAPAGPSEVEVTAEIDGQRQHGLVAIDPAPLDRISADECGRQFVLEQVDIGYGADQAVVDGVVETSIELRRSAGDEPITATAFARQRAARAAAVEGSRATRRTAGRGGRGIDPGADTRLAVRPPRGHREQEDVRAVDLGDDR